VPCRRVPTAQLALEGRNGYLGWHPSNGVFSLLHGAAACMRLWRMRTAQLNEFIQDIQVKHRSELRLTASLRSARAAIPLPLALTVWLRDKGRLRWLEVTAPASATTDGSIARMVGTVKEHPNGDTATGA